MQVGTCLLPLLNETPDDTQCVVQTPLALLQNETVATESKDADSPSPILDARYPHNLDARRAGLFHQVRIPKLILRERINVRNRLATQALRKELNLVALDILDDEDVEPLEESQRSVIDSVTKDRLLDQEDIAIRFLNFFANVE